MKRADLNVGAELFWSRSQDWEHPEYGAGDGVRVVVTATEPYEDPNRLGWSRMPPRRVDKGPGVLVKVYYKADGTGYPQVVPLSQLKGPYAETAAKVAAWCTERDRKQRENNDARAARATRADKLVARANDLGCRAHKWSDGNQAGVQLTLDEFEALLIRLEAVQ